MGTKNLITLLAIVFLGLTFLSCGKHKNPISNVVITDTIKFKEVDCLSDKLFGGNWNLCEMVIENPSGIPLAYSWKSNCGGEFESEDEFTIWTAPVVTQKTDCHIEGTISDGKTTISKGTSIEIVPGKAIDQDKINLALDPDSEDASLFDLIDIEGNPEDENGAIYTFEYTEEYYKYSKIKKKKMRGMPTVEVGEYFIVNEDEEGQEGYGGYLIEVAEVIQREPTLKIRAILAELDEIIEEGEFEGELDFSDSTFSSKLKGVKPLQLGTTIGAKFNNTTLLSTDGIKIYIPEGEITFEPKVRLSGGLGLFSGGPHFLASARGDLNAKFKGEVDIKKIIFDEEKITVAKYSLKPKTIWFGLFPVYFIPTLYFDVGVAFNAEATGNVTIPTRCNASLEAGIKYERGRWSQIWERRLEFNLLEGYYVDIRGETIVKVFVEPRIEIKVYNVAGPYLAVQPYAQFQAEAQQSGIKWDIFAAISGKLGAKIRFLSINIAEFGPVELFHFPSPPYHIAEGTINLQAKSMIISPDAKYRFLPKTIILSKSATFPERIYH